MGILDDMGVSKISAKVYLKVNYSFKNHTIKYKFDRCGTEYHHQPNDMEQNASDIALIKLGHMCF